MTRRLFRAATAVLAAGALAFLAVAAGASGWDDGIDPTPPGSNWARIKDLVDFEGVRGNDLVGYGLVVGLNGTGDGLRNSPFTEEALQNLLERLGVNVSGEQFRPRNVAAVLVTATLPPFARAGSRIDVTVSTIGDARSLLGGTLVMTPLNAADGEIYAVAQGSVISGGVSAEGEASRVTQGVPTAGRVPGGARIEREVDFAFDTMRSVRLAVREPDFTTAARVEAAIRRVYGGGAARMLDSGTVEVQIAAMRGMSPAEALSRIENLPVAPSQKARVVVDHRSGTVVLGSDVRISRIAVSQGGLTLRVTETPLVSQPSPFTYRGQAETVVVPRTEAEIQQNEGVQLAVVEEAVTLADLVAGLNALGVSPRDLIDILKTIKTAGALHAEFVVQ
ncbi:MAG: flagellar basal body P-ring protein FlgI [Rhodobacteraceae bacterium]|nr:MAG: flagellar basal body P-ring protein FlgI [Paracoccaceae bacterium]